MDGLTESEAYELESFILQEHRWDLVNKTTKPPRSAIHKRRLSESAKNRKKVKCECGFKGNSPGIYRHIKLCKSKQKMRS